MSTEIDEDRVDDSAAPAVIWSSDEAAAAQDKLVKESSPLDVEEEGIALADVSEQSVVAGRPISGAEALLSGETGEGFLRHWAEIQMSFVEDPRQAVQSADTLIQEIGATLRQAFEDRRSDLAAGWRDGTTDTEQLRQALWQYRSFISVIIPK